MFDLEKFLQDLKDDLANNRLTLPTLPEVALKARDAVADPEVTAGQVADIVATDPAISARLIQVANSPFFRARSPIDNLQTAISRMGIATVRDLVNSLAMQQIFQATNAQLDERLRALWEHSVQVAAISRVLAMAFPNLQPEQAMLAGLIHDVGALPILTRAEDEPKLLSNTRLLDRIVHKLHAKLGRIILASWNFPQSLIDVAAEHESLSRDPGGPVDYVDLVIVANLQSYIGSDHPLTQVDWARVPAFSRVGIEPDINIIDVEDNGEKIQEVQDMLLG